MTALSTGAVSGSDSLADDMLEGADQIGIFIGKTTRQTNHLLEGGRLPAFKLGGRWHMRRSTWRARIEALEAAAEQRVARNGVEHHAAA